MTKHFEREISGLKKRILTTGAMVEEMLREAVRSVEEDDVAAARWVIERDEAVDAYEIETEEECLKTLALHQPVAHDLRSTRSSRSTATQHSGSAAPTRRWTSCTGRHASRSRPTSRRTQKRSRRVSTWSPC
jgi:phosphate uptake regulator